MTRINLELSAPAADINAQCPRVLATRSPHLFEECGMRHDAIAVAHERLEYAVLQGRQAHLTPIEAASDPPAHIDRDVAEIEHTHRQLSAHVPPQDSPHAGQEFGCAERLQHVVVRSELECREPLRLN